MFPWRKFADDSPETTPLLSDSNRPANAGPQHDDHSTTLNSNRPPLERGQSPNSQSSAPEPARNGSNDEPVWSEPLGRPSRSDSDEHLLMFRRAVGINSDFSSPLDQSVLEQGRKNAVGIYRTVILQERRKKRMHHAVSGMVWACHGTQIVVGATLTCLGLKANAFPTTITVLGAVNTVVASILALVKGRSLPEKLGQTEADFRQLKVWIEETESLLALGIIGRDRREIGLLIETAFRRYNACFGRSFEIEADFDRGVDNMSVTEFEQGPTENDNIK